MQVFIVFLLFREKFAYEFPVINNRFLGKKNRYTYTLWKNRYEIFCGILKYDSLTNDQIYYEEKGFLFSEFYFVENENPKSEDDGFLVGYMVEDKSYDSYFAVLDSYAMKLKFKIKLPSRVPLGFIHFLII